MKLRLLFLIALMGISLMFPNAANGQSITPKTLVQQAKLTTAAGTQATSFGTRVSVNGTYALVSNQGETVTLSGQGAAYIFNRTGGNWVQQARIVDPNAAANDQFGYGVTDGTYAAIGSTRANSEKGKITFWKRSFVTWTLQNTLTGSDSAPGDRLGFNNAISGNTVVTGVPRHNSNAGAAYVFTRTSEVWTQQAKVVPGDLGSGNSFGTAVALDADTLVVGAPDQIVAPVLPEDQPAYGSVYVFVRSGTTWSLQQKIFVRGLDSGTNFGRGVGISGDRLIVGTDFVGTAFIYKRTGTTWALEQQLFPLVNYSNGFGFPVEIRGQRAVVGDRNCGCMTVLTFNGSYWSQQQQLKPSEPVTVKFPGAMAMSVTTNYVIASNNGVTDEAPQVFVFDSATAGARQDSVGIYRAGTFYLRYTNTTGPADASVTFGGDPSDKPIAGDWNGDGIDTIGVYRSNAGLYLLSDSNTTPAVNYQFTFGDPGDTPLAGRWSSTMVRDGTGVYRNSNGILYLREALSTGFSDYDMVMGNPGDAGIAGDWDGNGVDTVGVLRPSELRFYLSNVNGHGITFSDITLDDFATSELDVPVAGNWAGYSQSGIGIFTVDGKFKLKLDANVPGGTDLDISYGQQGDLPVIGRWRLPSEPPPPVLDKQNGLNNVIVTGRSSPSMPPVDNGGAD